MAERKANKHNFKVRLGHSAWRYLNKHRTGKLLDKDQQKGMVKTCVNKLTGQEAVLDIPEEPGMFISYINANMKYVEVRLRGGEF